MTSESELIEPSDESVSAEELPSGEQPSKNRRGGRRTGRSDGDERRPRRTERQLYAGWGDGVERCLCEALAPASPASGYPVQHRSELTIAQPFIVDFRDDAVLYCALEHQGAHVWPGGEVVADPLSFLPGGADVGPADFGTIEARAEAAIYESEVTYDLEDAPQSDAEESDSLVEFLR